MIPISIIDQLQALIQRRIEIESKPNAAWSEYLEGWHGPERKAAAALERESIKQEIKVERDRVANSLNLPNGVTPIWTDRTTAEILAFRATIINPTTGNRSLGEFPTLSEAIEAISEAIEAINSARAEMDAAKARRIKLTQASLPQKPNKSGLPSGVIRSKTKKGDRFSAVIVTFQHDGKRRQKMISTHATPEEAHRAYQIEHIKMHGERSRYWNQRHAL